MERALLSPLLRLRLSIMRGCLRFARWWAGVFLTWSKSGDPARQLETQPKLQSLYPMMPLGEKLGLKRCFEHETVVSTPERDRYPPLVLVAKLGVIAGLSMPVKTEARFRSLEETMGLSGSLGMPRGLRERWDHDEAFAALRLQGPNPAWIRRVEVVDSDLAELAGSESELYVVDYRDLLRDLPVVPGRHLTPCAAVFKVEREQLKTVGIVLDRPGQTALLARPDGSPGWRLARMYFGCADLHVHEALSHFLWTHMVAETLVLATRHHLDDAHPIARLLAPHALYTLQANENSGSRLLGDNGFFERCFSAGWEGTVELLERGQALFSFDQLVLPSQIEERGVGDLPSYPYRDDALPVWEAIERYVRSAVALSHDGDEAVLDDPQLQSWGRALRERLGAPVLDTRDTLVTIVTATLFTTVQHTLVNALQYDAYGWPLAFPSCLCQPLPSDLSEVTEQDLIDALPGVQVTIDAMRATFSFSIQFNVFGTGLEKFLPPEMAPLVARLRADLAAAEQAVGARNLRRGYRYDLGALPQISNSINA